jgi:chemotaxis-related protein WspB
MLILSLSIGNERYGIEAKRIVEIVPLIPLKKVPLAEKSIKGIFNYRGHPTPVIDLCQLFEQRDCTDSLSTRIIIIEYRALSGLSRPIGLIAEFITDVIKCEIEAMENSGIHKNSNDFLGLVYTHNKEIIQIIDTNKVLPESINSQLMNNIS